MFELILSPLTAFFIVLLATPAFIRVAKLKHLFDEPEEDRKLHEHSIPSMGGIMIFAATLFAFTLWFPNGNMEILKYLLPSILILFFVGVKDDIIGTAPVKKLIAHLMVAFIMVIMGDIRITSMYGLFWVWDLPYWASILISVFTFIVVINSFNLVDGVDGLAGGIGFIISVSFGVWFYLAGDMVNTVLAISLAGALIGFLRYNFSPAKIFMGDSGSLTVGLILVTLAIQLIEYKHSALPPFLKDVHGPIFAMSVLAYPLMDTLRIFSYRIAKGLPPFQADQNHIHHRLLTLGFSHRKTVFTLYFFNILIIGAAVIFKSIPPTYYFVGVGIVLVILIQLPFFLTKKKN